MRAELLPLAAWLRLSRLGEAQILLPVLLLACLGLAASARGRRVAVRWLGATALAALLTTASKLAFIGWGIGWEALDFTGVSGHAMFAAAVLPPLLWWVGGGPLAAWWLALGCALAAAVGMSRVAVGAHSGSEVLAGLALGFAAALAALSVRRPGVPRYAGFWLAAWIAWVALMVQHAPPSRTHDWVTRMALTLSGRDKPYQRPPPVAMVGAKAAHAAASGRHRARVNAGAVRAAGTGSGVPGPASHPAQSP